MPNLEQIRGIVHDELGKTDEAMQVNGQLIFEKILEQGAQEQVTCEFVRSEIKRLCSGKRERKKAMEIYGHIKDRISAESMQAGIQEKKNRISAEKMRHEILRVYEVIEKNGRGVVYLGSARTTPGHPYYEATRELGREVHLLLGTTSWTGAGPGQMEAPLVGAKEAGGNVAGVKIILDDDETTFEQSINSTLDPSNVAECRFFGPRKIGLADAAMRNKESDRTAIIATPGGFGTRDELYEYIVLKQLGKLGTNFEVPIIVHNLDGCFNHFQKDVGMLLDEKMISEKDLNLFTVRKTNREILWYLADFYEIPEDERGFMAKELVY